MGEVVSLGARLEKKRLEDWRKRMKAKEADEHARRSARGTEATIFGTSDDLVSPPSEK